MSYSFLIDKLNETIEGLISLQVTRENFRVSPKLRQPYVRTTLLPAESINTTQGQDNIMAQQGLFQIDVFYPSETGSSKAEVDQLITHFKNNRFIKDETLEKSAQIVKVWRGAGLSETDWYRIPVILRWQYFE